MPMRCWRSVEVKMADLPTRFYLAVGIDEHGKAFIVGQERDMLVAADVARAKAATHVGSVYAVMEVKDAFQASAPIARQVYLAWPPDEAEAPHA